jgi:hypothetical protein
MPERGVTALLVEDHVRQLFGMSNIDAGYVDFNVKVLEAVLSDTGWRSSDVLAITLSQQPQRLVVASKVGLALGAPKGGVDSLSWTVAGFSG